MLDKNSTEEPSAGEEQPSAAEELRRLLLGFLLRSLLVVIGVESRLDKNSTEERTASRYASEMGEVIGGGGFTV
jgi:hypothetical protein